MKAILISIKPKYVADILNGRKTIEIRKTMPKCDLPIDVYIYMTKNGGILGCGNGELPYLNGKVVAKFTLNKVEGIKFNDKNIQEKSCLSEDELFDYLFDNTPYQEDMRKGYAWHIDNLEIFDYPRELFTFHTNVKKEPPEELLCPECGEPMEYYEYKYLTKAPQNFCYVEVLK